MKNTCIDKKNYLQSEDLEEKHEYYCLLATVEMIKHINDRILPFYKQYQLAKIDVRTKFGK